MSRKSIKIDGYEINEKSQTYIVAEIGINHGGNLDKSIKLIDEAKSAGANAVKMQSYLTEKRVAADSPIFKILKDSELSFDQQETCIKHAKNIGITIFSTPFDDESVDFLESVNCPAYKIASFENNHIPLIKKAASTGKPLIISTGMASLGEIESSVKAARDVGCTKIVLLKCTSTYPASPMNTNIRTIPHLRQLFNTEVGLSDHSMGLGVALASVALGASVIEKHLTLSRADGGVDSAFSLEPNELEALVVESERAWQALGKISYGPTEAERASIKYRRSIYVAEDISEGEIFTKQNIRIVRPGGGASPDLYDAFLGKVATCSLTAGTPLNIESLFKMK